MSVEAHVAAALARLGEPVLHVAVAPALEALSALPHWPPAALPRLVAPAYGKDPEPLVAACVLFFAGADVMDDAQDGDLDAGKWPGGWRQATAAGMALAFAAAGELDGAAAKAFAEAGARMGVGQLADFALHGPLAVSPGASAHVACARAKTGASLGLFAAVGALGSPDAQALRAWGEAVGTALQLVSDVADLNRVDSKDRRQGRPTLAVARAWQRLSVGDRPLLEAAWSNQTDAIDLPFFIERSGALLDLKARLAVLHIEATDALHTAALPPGLAARLTAWADAAMAGQGDPQRV